MSATTGGAVKARIETLGLGMPVFRDGAGDYSKAPYIVVQEGIGMDTEKHGDVGDSAADMGVSELVQVDLYLPARVRTPGGPNNTANAESYTAPDKVHRGLHGAVLAPVGTVRVYGCLVESRLRWPIADNVSRHTLTVRVKRSIQ